MPSVPRTYSTGRWQSPFHPVIVELGVALVSLQVERQEVWVLYTDDAVGAEGVYMAQPCRGREQTGAKRK